LRLDYVAAQDFHVARANTGNSTGEISRKHGNTLVGTLRKQYGAAFAPGFKDTDKLSDVLANLDETSLTKLINDHNAGVLAGHIARHS
jgi:hypothetical protein